MGLLHTPRRFILFAPTLRRALPHVVGFGLLAVAAQMPWPTSAQPSPQGATAPVAAPAAATTALHAEARAQCERAVRQALAPGAGPATDVRLAIAPPAARATAAQDGAIVLQGEGQWRDGATPRHFKFSCNLDPHGGDAVGVVIRQSTPPPPPLPTTEPDLTHLSPAACESSAALALKQRWPRVAQISFDTATRSLSQHSATRAELRGQGRAQPVPESPALVHFGFECGVDLRDGRVLDMHLSG